jgi:broad specificity phosphatase PhoE
MPLSPATVYLTTRMSRSLSRSLSLSLPLSLSLSHQGEGTHNRFAATFQRACECARSGPCAYRNKVHTDAQLTELGRRQAAAAGMQLLTLPGCLPDVVYVSPLTRTLQTASIALGKAPGMARTPLIADERLRERFGVHCCDQRSPVEDVMPAFPTVDFGMIQRGPDPLHKDDEREPNDHVAARAKTFLLDLLSRPEKNVAIFAHSAFYRETLRLAVLTPNPNVARRFATGEVRICLLTYA